MARGPMHIGFWFQLGQIFPRVCVAKNPNSEAKNRLQFWGPKTGFKKSHFGGKNISLSITELAPLKPRTGFKNWSQKLASSFRFFSAFFWKISPKSLPCCWWQVSLFWSGQDIWKPLDLGLVMRLRLTWMRPNCLSMLEARSKTSSTKPARSPSPKNCEGRLQRIAKDAGQLLPGTIEKACEGCLQRIAKGCL